MRVGYQKRITAGDKTICLPIPDKSAFGSGWGLAGSQELVINNDSLVLVIDGSELLFERNAEGAGYKSPISDFSTLERLGDGTFRCTITDQMIYGTHLRSFTRSSKISEDPIGFEAGDNNLYRYVGNSPTNANDPSGLIVDTGLDVISIGYDIYRIAKDNIFGNCDNLGENLLALGADVVGALVPFATGGAVVRAGKAANQAIDAAKAAERAAEATRNIDRAADASKGLDNAGDAAKSSNVADTQKALNPTECFIAGTEIITRDGTKNIEDIQVGDWVLADDPNTVGEIEYKQVLQTFARSATATIDLYIDGEKITTTEEHPFWVPGVGWVAAKDLNVGTYLQTKTESWLDIDKIESHTSPTNVYNFEVEGFHTYFVSDLGFLVHNSCREDVIKETIDGKGNITSNHTISVDDALDTGTKFLGDNYKEIGKPGSGVFRSADGTKQFRIDNNSIQGNHAPDVPHVHFETYGSGSTKPITNNHVPIIE